MFQRFSRRDWLRTTMAALLGSLSWLAGGRNAARADPGIVLEPLAAPVEEAGAEGVTLHGYDAEGRLRFVTDPVPAKTRWYRVVVRPE